MNFPITTAQEQGPDRSLSDPVFILCNARSGSTLLRFVLDAHPDLACPAETKLPAMAAQLAIVWSLIEGASPEGAWADKLPDIPDVAIAATRRTLCDITDAYLRRRGKLRYCDKNLGTARWAGLLLKIFPDAKFICLYRSAMDVVASGVEAAASGLKGFGFESYIAAWQGNAVNGLAQFWIDNATTILAVEERFAPSCHRVRYEDLVSRPEDTAAQIFQFLEVRPQPGLTDRCLTTAHERFGSADYKIWATSQISDRSVGRSGVFQESAVEPALGVSMSELMIKLGYGSPRDW